MVQNIIQPVDSIILEPLLHLHNCRVSPFFKCYAIWDPMPVEHAVHNPKCCSWSRQTGKANSYLDYSFLWQWSISVSNGKGLMLSTNWEPSSQLVSTNNAKPRSVEKARRQKRLEEHLSKSPNPQKEMSQESEWQMKQEHTQVIQESSWRWNVLATQFLSKQHTGQAIVFRWVLSPGGGAAKQGDKDLGPADGGWVRALPFLLPLR